MVMGTSSNLHFIKISLAPVRRTDCNRVRGEAQVLEQRHRGRGVGACDSRRTRFVDSGLGERWEKKESRLSQGCWSRRVRCSPTGQLGNRRNKPMVGRTPEGGSRRTWGPERSLN